MSDPYGNNAGGQSPYGQNPNPYGGSESGGSYPPPPPGGGYSGGGYPGGGSAGGGHPGGGSYPAGGFQPAPSTDGVSIAALVTSFLCCLAPIGVILGFIGLGRTKDGQRKGRGLAIAAIPIGIVMTLAIGVGVTFIVIFAKSIVTPDNAEAGQCINVSLEDDDTVFLRKKDCADDHDGEIVYVGKSKEGKEAAAAAGMDGSLSGVTSDEDAQKVICSRLVGDQADGFPDDLEWHIAFDEDDRDNPGDNDPFLCYVTSDSKLDKSLL